MNKLIISFLFLGLTACGGSRDGGTKGTTAIAQASDCRKMGSIELTRLISELNSFLNKNQNEFIKLSDKDELASSMFFVSEIAIQDIETAEAIVESSLYVKLYKTVLKNAEAGTFISADDLANCY